MTLHRLSRRKLLLATGAALSVVACEGAQATTPAETEGPFFPLDTNIERDADLTRLAGRTSRALGQVIEFTGRLLDTAGKPIAGARIELWQANAAGRYAHPGDAGNKAALDPNFQGYALFATGPDGTFRAVTIKPAGYNVGTGARTPHLHWKIAAGGRKLTTQSYFPNEPQNETDALMRAMGEVSRKLIAREAQATEPGALGFVWEVALPV